MKKILIATTNIGKLKEIMAEFSDLHFNFVSLKDLKLDKIEVDEPHATTWHNALEKAKFFAKKTGILTIAEDTGLFIDALHGEPGVRSKRLGTTPKERINTVLKLLEKIPNQKRTAYFETSGCVYDPTNDSFSIFKGTVKGLINKQPKGSNAEGMSYDSIFYYPPFKKMFSEITPLEKTRISHRGQVVNQIRYFLTKNYKPRQLICAAGIIVKDGKMLMTKRRDIRPEFNGKWEFPGGGVEDGETVVQTVQHELIEEAGVRVNLQEQLPDIVTTVVTKDAYQVHLFMYICTIKSGTIKLSPSESSEYGWFTYKEALQMNMLPLNKKLIQTKENKKILLKYIT
jgi:XTP/dITP diphosphohydrolase